MVTKPCEWCPDDTCSDYWRVKVFEKVHRICNCCYEHLEKETDEERFEAYEQHCKETKDDEL